jgi:ABC-type phosphate/phosphonate transport system substrate-binding protein
MNRIASLPMYNFAGLRGAHVAMWGALAARLRESGLADVPAELNFAAPPVPARIAEEVLFTQTCGYPLQRIYAGQYRLLAMPDYDAPGCGSFTHSAWILVRSDDGRQEIGDLSGSRFGYNSPNSNSGLNLPRALFAPLARGKAFFSALVETGSHPASIAALRAGDVDAVAVDCLTWAFATEHSPGSIAGLRVLCATGESPTIPYVTSVHTPADAVSALREALLWFGVEPRFAELRARLRLRGIGPTSPDHYAHLLTL